MARVPYTSLKRLAAQVPQKKKDLMITHQVLEIFGSDGRDRTYDQLINSQLLYR